ncbi:MAG: DegT/DnrJ/EryC1/StrS family aminotransferase [Lachnospiraceae bacterium]|nr:DegT/DnrJ/EryC1/StrS family aminotransferase [Lachnospiraceae bacterium]
MDKDITKDKRFSDLKQFTERIPLAIPHMHGDEIRYVQDAYETDWVTTVGENINEVEHMTAEYVGLHYGVALSSGTAALHLAIRLAADNIYHSDLGDGSLRGHKVFCSDMTFAATVNPIVYEGGEPVFIDSEYETWNMDPAALEKAFSVYPDVKLVVLVHLYGIPAKLDEIRSICNAHGALLVEDAAESLGALYKGRQTGSFGDYTAVSFNGNKIITGSTGGMFLTNNCEAADRVRKWSTQARDTAAWYQHTEIGYNYRMSNIVAGIIRGQWEHIEEHISRKKEIYTRYKKAFQGLPVRMNPYDAENCEPNFWLSCIQIDPDGMCPQERTDTDSRWESSGGKSCPDEMMTVLKAFHVESRPIWKPMHLQPIYHSNKFISSETGNENDTDIFQRGLCLPSDIGMSDAEQDKVIDVIKRCFG